MINSDQLALANVAYQEQRYSDAKAYLEPIVQADPSNAEAIRLLGYCCQGMKQFSEAETFAQKLLFLDPSDVLAQYALGIALSGQERHKDAAEAFEQVLSVSPDHAYAREGLMLSLLGDGLRRIGSDDRPGGEAQLIRAVKVGKGDPRPLVALARHFIDTAQTAKAKQYVSGALAHGQLCDDLNDLAIELGLRDGVSREALQNQKAKQTIMQVQQVRCPSCGMMAPDSMTICPHCRMRIRDNAQMSVVPKTTWQETAYKIMSVIWILMGGYPIASSFLLHQEISFVSMGEWSICIMIGLGSLIESEFLEFLAKRLLFFIFFFGSVGLIIGLAKGHLGRIGMNTFELGLASFQIYLINFLGSD